jgi:hypothetical protein
LGAGLASILIIIIASMRVYILIGYLLPHLGLIKQVVLGLIVNDG